ncbi:MAG: dienelactone hydrolase family protein [Terricaulis sp.]
MGEWLEIKGPDGGFRAYVARPAGAPKAAVVAIQEIFGVNAVMRGKADWLACEGYLAIAPDLFWRLGKDIDISDQSEAEWAQAFDYFKRFDVGAGVHDIQATIAHARGMGCAKVGAVGYCLGGMLAYLTATRTDADASVGYYGVGIAGLLSEGVNIKKPLMLHIAGKDAFVQQADQDAMHAGLGSNRNVTLHTYADQDHAFTREGGKHYDAAAAKLADGRTIAFFQERLP